jgi:hypothetical protein
MKGDLPRWLGLVQRFNMTALSLKNFWGKFKAEVNASDIMTSRVKLFG